MSRINSVIGRGSGSAAAAAPAAATGAPSSSAYGEFKSGLGDVTRGRVTLLMLDTLILLLVVFYVWTHKAQGGG